MTKSILICLALLSCAAVLPRAPQGAAKVQCFSGGLRIYEADVFSLERMAACGEFLFWEKKGDKPVRVSGDCVIRHVK